MKTLTRCQVAALDLLAVDNRGYTHNVLARRLDRAGHIKNHGRMTRGNLVQAGSAILQALERRNLVYSYRTGSDWWSSRLYFISVEGRAARLNHWAMTP